MTDVGTLIGERAILGTVLCLLLESPTNEANR